MSRGSPGQRAARVRHPTQAPGICTKDSPAVPERHQVGGAQRRMDVGILTHEQVLALKSRGTFVVGTATTVAEAKDFVEPVVEKRGPNELMLPLAGVMLVLIAGCWRLLARGGKRVD